MTIRDDQHKVIPFDQYLEDHCDTASIEWIDEQLQINGLDAGPVLENVQRIIARREAEDAAPARPEIECAARQGWRKPVRMLSKVAAILIGVPLLLAGLDINSAMNLNVIGAGIRTPEISTGALPMFTTREVRDQFLGPTVAPRSLTIDMFKEAYFREHVPYGEIIFREARRNDLPPELVAAMVHTESDFRTTLVSARSAQGLMQIVPSTALILGIQDPFDPEENIAAGTKHFRELLDRFDDETIALAAYNAGELNVERFGGVPPFDETKTYIVKVNRRADRYRQRVHNTYIATVRVKGLVQ